MSDKKFSDALAKIPYSVSVVTVGLGGVENGLTVSWCSQVSFTPPMLMFSIAKTHYSTDLLKDHGRFVLNLLSSEQSKVAAHFAKQSMLGEDKIDQFPTRPAKSDVPILTEALAYFDCRVTETVEAGDHLIVLGAIEDAGVLNQGKTLTSDSGMRYRG
jgi:flavin reductase (DIM6/NTAB) family NADH-FMN oxidoreductase RutF